MLRISNLLRGKVMPRKIPMRSGLPNWDRPDPPATPSHEIDHQFSDEQLQFTFFDRDMPEFYITQPEIYEGDSLLEATPMLLKGLGLILGISTFIGLTVYYSNPLKTISRPHPYLVQKSKEQKEMVSSKKWFQWANQNPIGIKVTSENYPPRKCLDPPNTPWSAYKQIDQRQDYFLQVNKQVQTYLTNVKEKAKKIVKQRQAAKNAHSHSHQQHITGHNEHKTQQNHHH